MRRWHNEKIHQIFLFLWYLRIYQVDLGECLSFAIFFGEFFVSCFLGATGSLQPSSLNQKRKFQSPAGVVGFL